MQEIKPRGVNPPHLNGVITSQFSAIYFTRLVFFFFVIYMFSHLFSKRMGIRTGNLDWHYIVLEIMYIHCIYYMFVYPMMGYFATRIFWHVSI